MSPPFKQEGSNGLRDVRVQMTEIRLYRKGKGGNYYVVWEFNIGRDEYLEPDTPWPPGR
ncbi:MAG TPA: hypothetical protein VEJ19_05075 [Nitrososphaerales archaeon]|nr:hypothetical protein [Nitrososphaerales archaeon]